MARLLRTGIAAGAYWNYLAYKGMRISQNLQVEKMSEPIDFVVSWVDGNDPDWKTQKRQYQQASGIQYEPKHNGEERYRDWELFRYWFRGVEKYAPWVRNVYLITWGHIPEWLNQNAPKLKVVKHTDYIPSEYLPVFSSIPIELNLHRIEGLSEYFVYFNDDMFLNRPVVPEDFFRGGLINYPAIADPLRNDDNSAFTHMLFSTLGAINQKFTGKIQDSIKNNPEKWFAEWYSDEAIALNQEIGKKTYLSGMYFTHLPCPFRKSTFEKVWNEFPGSMEQSSMHRFRTPQDVFHFIFTLWDIAEGDFCPVSRDHYGKLFWAPVKQQEEITEAICSEKYRCICINDSESISHEEYLTLKQVLMDAMERALPGKSIFEK